MTIMQWCLFCTIFALTMLVVGCNTTNQDTNSSMVADTGPGNKLYAYPGPNMNINQPASTYISTYRGRPVVHTVNPNFQSY